MFTHLPCKSLHHFFLKKKKTVHLVFFRAFLIVFLEISRVLPTAVQVLFLYPSFFQLLSYKEVKPLWSYSMMAPIAAFLLLSSYLPLASERIKENSQHGPPQPNQLHNDPSYGRTQPNNRAEPEYQQK
jgi:hypothetical protein